MKTSDLTGPALDWAACEAAGLLKAYAQFRSGRNFLKVWGVARNEHLHPSTVWAQGGPILEREFIELVPGHPWKAVAHIEEAVGDDIVEVKVEKYGPTPLIAAMRCYVASKLGDEVEVPDELV